MIINGGLSLLVPVLLCVFRAEVFLFSVKGWGMLQEKKDKGM
jgi:hypothetical protein